MKERDEIEYTVKDDIEENNVIPGLTNESAKIKMHVAQMRELIEDTLKILGKKRHDYGLSFDDSVKKYGGVAYEIALDWKINRVHSFHEKGELKNESLEDALRDIIGYTLLYWRILKFGE